MIVGINLIALSTQTGTGPFSYIKRILTQMGKYQISDCLFIIYKQKHIPKEYFEVPPELNVTFVDVPTLGNGIRRIIFEQTLFYFYIKKCDAFYSFCTSMPLFVRTKRFFTLHDVYYLTFSKRYGKIKTMYLKWITKLYIRQSRKVFTVSEYSKNEICDLLNIDKNKIEITYNFVLPSPPQTITLQKIKDVNGNNVDLNKRFFLYVGSLQPGKNIQGMVDGFRLFMENNTDWQLIIVGKPTHKGESIINYIKNRSNVFYLGYQPGNVVDYLFSKCFATVLLSFCEGFGIPPIEGFLYGKPTLVSDRTSLPEVAGEAGIKVNPYNIQEISEGFETLTKRYDDYARKVEGQLKKFSPENSVETFMKTIGIPFSKRT